MLKDRIGGWVKRAFGLGYRPTDIKKMYSRPVYDASTEIRRQHEDLLREGRQTEQNNPDFFKGIGVLQYSSVGVGIRPAISGVKGAVREAARFKAFWDDFAKSTDCDAKGMKNLYGIQSLAARSMFLSGSVFLRRVFYEGRLQIQTLEVDHLDKNKTIGVDSVTGMYTLNGIEYNRYGRPTAYWLYMAHPKSATIFYNTESVRVSAQDVIHLYRELRPNQDIGLPSGVTSVRKLGMIEQYERTRLTRETVAATFAAFITQQDLLGAGGEVKADRDEFLSPGTIQYMNAGESVTFSTPPPVEGHKEYMASLKNGAAAGLEIPYAAMTGDLSEVNFSSGRMGHIEFGLFMDVLQDLTIIPVMCNRLMEWVLDYAVLRGVIKSKEGIKYEFTAPRREFVDPLKEVNAMVLMVNNGLMSWSEAIRQLGFNPDDVEQQIIEDGKRKIKQERSVPASDAERGRSNG